MKTLQEFIESLPTEERANLDKLAQFLEELTTLSNKYGLVINGCGCCGSPSLDPIELNQTVVTYTADLKYVSSKSNYLNHIQPEFEEQ